MLFYLILAAFLIGLIGLLRVNSNCFSILLDILPLLNTIVVGNFWELGCQFYDTSIQLFMGYFLIYAKQTRYVVKNQNFYRE
jgi:hypothetical protein